MLDLYVVKDGKELRCGYTTGSCAAAAAKAAATALETGEMIKYIEIDTPAGVRLRLEVNDLKLEDDYAEASIIKDAGDDPDSTDGIKIFARLKKREDGQVLIDGGPGIGRIKKKGLFGRPGEAAINPVPREMIRKEVLELSQAGYDVLIYAPEGEAIGRKTFNANIGIEGGISIIGSKGIVYPMSEDALLKTIYLEIDMVVENKGLDNIVLVPGNYGEKIAEGLGLDIPMVKVSNYIGNALLYAHSKGFKAMTLIGHIGKFAKLAVGAFNTHSKICDIRMESFVYYLAFLSAPRELIEKVDGSLTAEEALNICIEAGYPEIVKKMEEGAARRVKKYIKDDSIDIDVIIYSMERGVDI